MIMEQTNTADSRDWVSSSRNLKLQLTVPQNFCQGQFSSIISFELSHTHASDDRNIDQQLSAYIRDFAGSEDDLDRDFETAAIEHWISIENESETE
jgi:hypothetical protein